jgi:hypothetical protein
LWDCNARTVCLDHGRQQPPVAGTAHVDQENVQSEKVAGLKTNGQSWMSVGFVLICSELLRSATNGRRTEVAGCSKSSGPQRKSGWKSYRAVADKIAPAKISVDYFHEYISSALSIRSQFLFFHYQGPGLIMYTSIALGGYVQLQERA